MEHEEYGRNDGIGETLQIATRNLPSNKHITYSNNINELTNDEDVVNIKNMMEAENKGIILVRGYSIEEQMRTTQNEEPKYDGTMTFTLSHSTGEMFNNDANFIKRLQLEQMQLCKVIGASPEVAADESVLHVREATNLIGDDKKLLDEMSTEI